MAVQFDHIKDLKRQPVDRGASGFPVPMAKQMNQHPRKLKFPKPDRLEKK